jgi:hypothetical protein
MWPSVSFKGGTASFIYPMSRAAFQNLRPLLRVSNKSLHVFRLHSPHMPVSLAKPGTQPRRLCLSAYTLPHFASLDPFSEERLLQVQVPMW